MKTIFAHNWRRHLYYWLIYGVYFYAINLLANTELSIQTVMLSLPYFALVFYTVTAILNRFFTAKRYLVGTSMLVVFYVLSGTVIYLILYTQDIGVLYGRYVVDRITFRWRDFIQSSLIMHGHFSILAVLYYQYQKKLLATQEKLEQINKRLEIEQQKEQFEYTSLAAQVSPHMMANVFQGWQQKLKEHSPDIAAQVQEMYQIMVFYMDAHQSNGHNTILLIDEVKAVKRFVAMQNEIAAHPVCIEWEIQGNLYGAILPPTSLLVLVENAMKYGDVHRPADPMKVHIHTDRQQVRIEVVNRKAKTRRGLHSHGQGLSNLTRRLDIIFGKAYSLDMRQDEN